MFFCFVSPCKSRRRTRQMAWRFWGPALASAAMCAPAAAQWLNQPLDNGNAVLSAAVGQSFVAPASLSIGRIAVRPGLPLSGTLYLYTGAVGSGVDGGVGSPVYTQTGVSLAGSSGGGPWRSVVLSTPFPVTAGSSYTFMLAADAGPPAPEYFMETSNPYPGGTVVANYGLVPPPTWDLAFQIWAAQSISFTSTVPTAPRVGDSYAVTATATSGLPVAFTIAAASAAVCTIAGSTVTVTGVGTCTVNANQAGNTTYDPAPQAQQAFVVSAAPAAVPTLSFWGLLGLSSLLGLWGAARTRRRAG
jgi:hypothetical protein